MARDFSGTQRLDWAVPVNLAGGPMSFSVWLYIDTKDTTYRRILSIATASDAGEAISIWYTTGASGIGSGSVGITRPTGLQRIGQANWLETGSWHHWCFTHDGTFNDYTTIKIYKDGVEASPYLVDGGFNGFSEVAATGTWSLGERKYDSSRQTDGKLANLGVWNYVIPESQIISLAAGFSPLCYPTGLLFAPPLLGYAAEIDPVSGLVATHDGTTVAKHPRTFWPDPGSDVFYSIPAAGGGATVEPPVASSVAAMLAPVVTGGAAVDAAIASATSAMLAPTVAGGASVSGEIASSNAAMLAPTVTGGASVAAAIAASNAAMLAPTVTGDEASPDYSDAISYHAPYTAEVISSRLTADVADSRLKATLV